MVRTFPLCTYCTMSYFKHAPWPCYSKSYKKKQMLPVLTGFFLYWIFSYWKLAGKFAERMALKMRGCLRGLGSRSVYTMAAGEQAPAVVVGVIQGDNDDSFSLTPSGMLNCKLLRLEKKYHYNTLSPIYVRGERCLDFSCLNQNNFP